MEKLRLTIMQPALLVPACAFLLLSACSSGDSTGVEKDVTDSAAELVDVISGETGIDLAEETAVEVAPDLLPPDEVVDTVEETVTGGEFGDPCEDDADCQSGICIQTADGMACSQLCEDACPKGFSCENPVMELWVCVPYMMESCMPCQSQAECGAGYRCASYGIDGYFCAPTCADGEDCPSGYSCKDSFDVDGQLFAGCMKQAGACECNEYFVSLGAATSCVNGNEWGGCEGKRECTEQGLSPCDAPFAEEEVCDGDDNDCDGEADEDLQAGVCTLENEFGVCPGNAVCVDGEFECQGQIPVEEECDNLDNDCNGEIDEGFPDSNGDGIIDCLEKDSDEDGWFDYEDNCPLAANPDQEDLDEDGDGDECDEDDDGDGTTDEDDCEPLDADVHPGAEEKCNLQDDNCDGEADEVFPDTNGDGVPDCISEDDDGDGVPDVDDNCPAHANPDQENFDEDGAGDVCDLDDDNDQVLDEDDCSPFDATIFPGAAEVCDGKDNDCNEQVDEDQPPVTCGEGVCEHTIEACVDGVLQWCDPLEGAGEEACDALDNDCDAEVDEDLGTTTCGLGPCEHTVDNCVGGVPQVCDPEEGSEFEECDGVDNDCDAEIDEDTGGAECAFEGEAGVCVGMLVCEEGELVCNAAEPQPEQCDGVDNDCNGEVDEGTGGDACTLENEFGVCEGAFQCLDGQLLCDAAVPGPDVCDGMDNDCDGELDEDSLMEVCVFANEFGTCEGVLECVDAELACSAQIPEAELCDGVDNDCNGEVDEGLGTTTCGLGPCEHTVDNCAGGVPQVCDPMEGFDLEECDGLDNDCDDEVDEELGTTTCGFGPCENTVDNCADGLPQVCEPIEAVDLEICDGVDNDCDGEVDEELGTTTCGLGECEHTVDNCADGLLQVCDPMEGFVFEECDGFDNDCDGEVDELGAGGCEAYYLDNDEDGWGTDDSACQCAPAAPFTAAQAGDCNDDSPNANPGLTEQCGDELDNDCVADTTCMWVTQGDQKFEVLPLKGEEDVVEWYGYGVPDAASANTGLNLTNQVQLMLYEDPDGLLYVVVIVDDVNDGSGGAFTMTVSGLQGTSAVVEDDPGENGNTFKYDPATGDAEFKWTWAPCCTDGVVVGPLGCADGGFEISITSSGISGIDSVVVRNPDDELITVPDMTATFTVGKLADPADLPPEGEILADCKAILDGGLSTGSGAYWIDPDGGDTANALEVICDMDTNGGGWTLCGKFDRDNPSGIGYLPAGFARAPVFSGNLGSVAGFCGTAASHDCRALVQNGATQILNVGVDEDSTTWADGRIIDLHEEVITDPTNLWDVELDEDGIGECTTEAVTTRDLDGVDLAQSDGGAVLYDGAAIIGDGAFWTNDVRNGASFSNAGSGVTHDCAGTGNDTVYWTWKAADGSFDDHGCGAGAGYLQLGTGCYPTGTWQKPTYRYNLMFMR